MKKETTNLPQDKVLILLKEIESNSQLTQRDLSRRLAISLGKINYLLSALVDKGWVEMKNFKESKNKLGFVYLLTPNGIRTKVHLTQQFLQWKMDEYEKLKGEIESLKKEVYSIDQQNSVQKEAQDIPKIDNQLTEEVGR